MDLKEWMKAENSGGATLIWLAEHTKKCPSISFYFISYHYF